LWRRTANAAVTPVVNVLFGGGRPHRNRSRVRRDRPYKKAVPVERAIDILDFSVKDGHLDADLVRLFNDARVWERAEAARGT
jgi:hypothetical protein